MHSTDPSVVIPIWIRHAHERREEDFWAWDWVHRQVNWDATPDAAWNLVLALLHAAPDHVIAHVSAGPLEDLVERFGGDLIDRIEHQAAFDPRFREALGAIWLRIGDLPPDIEARIVAASGGVIEPFELTPAQEAAMEAEFYRAMERKRGEPPSR